MTVLKYRPRTSVPNEAKPLQLADGDNDGVDFCDLDLFSLVIGICVGVLIALIVPLMWIIGTLTRWWLT